MTEPIGNGGDSQIIPVARIGGDHIPNAAGAGAQQSGPILLTTAQEFGGYSSPDQIAVLLASVQLLVGAGLAAVDVADSMYSNSFVLDALPDGNPEAEK